MIMPARLPLPSFILGLAIALLSAITPTSAHHGFYMDYETRYAYWLEGVVVEGYFGMPHADLTLQLDEDPMPPEGFESENAADLLEKIHRVPWNLRGKEVDIEFPQQKMFYDLGDVLKEGDRVVAIVYRGCKKPFPLRGQWILLPDGESLRAVGKVQREIRRCRTNQ